MTYLGQWTRQQKLLLRMEGKGSNENQMQKTMEHEIQNEIVIGFSRLSYQYYGSALGS